MEQKLSITQTQRLLKESVGDVYEIEEFLSAKKIINHDLTEYLLRHSRI